MGVRGGCFGVKRELEEEDEGMGEERKRGRDRERDRVEFQEHGESWGGNSTG